MKIRVAFFLILFIASKGVAQTYDQWIESSFSYIERNQLDSAEIVLVNALRLEPANPMNPLVLNNLGTIQRRQGKKKEALVSYTAALGQAPKNTTLLEARASLFTEMGQTENALLDYSSLIAVEPANEEALYLRGLLYLQLKNYERAEADFNRILELNPNTLYGRLGIASVCKFRQEFDEAEKIYYFLEDKLPDNPEVYAGRAELYLLMNKPSKALTDVNKAIRLRGENKQDPYLYIIRCKAKLLLHEKSSARDDVEKAVALGYDPVEAEILKKQCK